MSSFSRTPLGADLELLEFEDYEAERLADSARIGDREQSAAATAAGLDSIVDTMQKTNKVIERCVLSMRGFYKRTGARALGTLSKMMPPRSVLDAWELEEDAAAACNAELDHNVFVFNRLDNLAAEQPAAAEAQQRRRQQQQPPKKRFVRVRATTRELAAQLVPLYEYRLVVRTLTKHADFELLAVQRLRPLRPLSPATVWFCTTFNYGTTPVPKSNLVGLTPSNTQLATLETSVALAPFIVDNNNNSSVPAQRRQLLGVLHSELPALRDSMRSCARAKRYLFAEEILAAAEIYGATEERAAAAHIEDDLARMLWDSIGALPVLLAERPADACFATSPSMLRFGVFGSPMGSVLQQQQRPPEKARPLRELTAGGFLRALAAMPAERRAQYDSHALRLAVELYDALKRCTLRRATTASEPVAGEYASAAQLAPTLQSYAAAVAALGSEAARTQLAAAVDVLCGRLVVDIAAFGTPVVDVDVARRGDASAAAAPLERPLTPYYVWRAFSSIVGVLRDIDDRRRSWQWLCYVDGSAERRALAAACALLGPPPLIEIMAEREIMAEDEARRAAAVAAAAAAAAAESNGDVAEPPAKRPAIDETFGAMRARTRERMETVAAREFGDEQRWAESPWRTPYERALLFDGHGLTLLASERTAIEEARQRTQRIAPLCTHDDDALRQHIGRQPLPCNEQLDALRAVIETPCLVLSGQAGSGKTQSLEYLQQLCMPMVEQQPAAGSLSWADRDDWDETCTDVNVPTGSDDDDVRVVVCALTNQVASALRRRVRGANVYAATTHRLLYTAAQTAGMLRRLEWLIVDEASMQYTALFARVAALAASSGTLRGIVLCGDVAQLPPIQPGALFAPLCRYLRRHWPAAVRCFEHNHRVERAAHELGQLGAAMRSFETDAAVMMDRRDGVVVPAERCVVKPVAGSVDVVELALDADGDDVAAAVIVTALRERLNARSAADMRGVQIITMRNATVRNLNYACNKMLFGGDGQPFIYTALYVGERLLFKENRPTLDVYNNELYELLRIEWRVPRAALRARVHRGASANEQPSAQRDAAVNSDGPDNERVPYVRATDTLDYLMAPRQHDRRFGLHVLRNRTLWLIDEVSSHAARHTAAEPPSQYALCVLVCRRLGGASTTVAADAPLRYVPLDALSSPTSSVRTAWAATCYSMQGAQCPTVIYVLPARPSGSSGAAFVGNETRAVAYTACSRAQRHLFYVGAMQALYRTLATPAPSPPSLFTLFSTN
jgi:hypothetical protein